MAGCAAHLPSTCIAFQAAWAALGDWAGPKWRAASEDGSTTHAPYRTLVLVLTASAREQATWFLIHSQKGGTARPGSSRPRDVESSRGCRLAGLSP